MENRKFRKGIAEETLSILEEGYYLTNEGKKIEIDKTQQDAEQNTIVYSPEQSDILLENHTEKVFFEPANIIVNDSSTLDAVRDLLDDGYNNVLCLILHLLKTLEVAF